MAPDLIDLTGIIECLLARKSALVKALPGRSKFSRSSEAMGAVSLTPGGRTRFLEAYERRMSQEITHPVFGYRISYRRVLEVQGRLLARHLNGEVPEYPSFTTR